MNRNLSFWIDFERRMTDAFESWVRNSMIRIRSEQVDQAMPISGTTSIPVSVHASACASASITHASPCQPAPDPTHHACLPHRGATSASIKTSDTGGYGFIHPCSAAHPEVLGFDTIYREIDHLGASRQLMHSIRGCKSLNTNEKHMPFNTMIIIRISPPSLPACCELVQDRHARPGNNEERVRNHKVRGGRPWEESREPFYLILQQVNSPGFLEKIGFEFFSFFQNGETR